MGLDLLTEPSALRNNQKQTQRGFTLIELLVVIAIIALLSSVVLATLSSARMKARDARRLSDAKQIAIAMQLYYDANGSWPLPTANWDSTSIAYTSDISTGWLDIQSSLAPYISKLPVDPLQPTVPFHYYIVEFSSTTAAGVACAGSGGNTLAATVVFASEVTQFDLTIWDTWAGKTRYCVPV